NCPKERGNGVKKRASLPILMEKTGREAKNGRPYRLIGLDYKIRARTMRGFKNWPKALEHCYLSE
ncbi:MAG: hypothetical protein JW749_10275, partial [Sedimentisphaerales bacterium]|nr:hypothetical protein [Sedimentisphaerales bacterium]